MKTKFASRIGMLLLSLIMVLSFAACGGDKTDAPANTDPPASDADQDATTDPAADPEPAADPITITYASNDAPGALRYDIFEQGFADLMKEKTNGRITVEIYPSGSLSKPGELLDAIKAGTVDSGQDSFTRYPGQYPYFDLLTAPGWKFSTFEEFSSAASEYVTQFADASASDYKIIVLADAGQFGLASAKPIKSIADIKGKAVRNTPQFIPLFDKLGASSVDVSSGEMYEALKLNTLDAVNTNNHAIPNFHLEEVCAGFTYLPIEHTDVSIFMSQKLYDSFDPELQAQVDEVCEAMKQVALDYIKTATDDAVDSTLKANPDFQFIDLSDAEIATLQEDATGILADMAKKLDDKGLKGTDALEWIKAHQSK
jgi:TRAP-type C4-dicarboxylate transport system substrate-binding protein